MTQRDDAVPENEEVLEMPETTLQASQKVQGSNSGQDPDQTVDPIQSLETDQIDESLLKALGERVAVDKPPGTPISEEIVLRWTDLFKVGLPKEEKSLLLKKYNIPENCSVINPAKINPEVKASLQEAVITRDSRLVEKQEKVAVCLAILGTILSDLLKGQAIDKLTLLERLSDTGRLLTDLQREETLTRKALILPNLNASVKDALKATVVDEWLFGKQLEEKLKTAKTLERSAKGLSKTTPKLSVSHNPKNFKALSRQQISKRQSTTTGGQKKSYRQRHSGYRKPDSKHDRYYRKKRH